MRTAQQLLDRLASLDVKLELEGDQLRVNAPGGVLNPELKRELLVHKSELLALLATRSREIRPAPAEAVIPLTNGQMRLWALIALRGNTGVYNVPMVYRLHGSLDVNGLESSLDEIQRRHTILRTTFSAVDGIPRQRVADSMSFALKTIDLTKLPTAEQVAGYENALDAAIGQPFDLAKFPLWRCTLVHLNPDEWVLVLTIHHIVFDLFSKTVFLRELEALYAGKKLPTLKLQYRDFAYSQQREVQQVAVDRQMSYWKAQFSNPAAELLLPTDHPRPAGGATLEGRSQIFVVPATVTDKLITLGRILSVSMYMTLLAVFHSLIHRYTGQSDQIICSPVACRNGTDTETLIGYFSNIVPVRTDLSGDPTFRDLVGRVRGVSMDAFQHQDAPFDRVAALTGTPLTRAMFNFRGEDSSVLNLPGLTATPTQLRRREADFDLALYMGVEGGVLGGVLDYNAGIFEDQTIRALLSNFQTVLQTVAEHPDQPLSSLPSLRRRFPSIEDVLLNHPMVDDAAVVVRSDAGGTSNLAAYVVLNEDAIPSQEELHAVVQDHLPDNGERLAFIPLDHIPRTPDEALDLAALTSPTLSRESLRNAYVAPRTRLEKDLASIWQRVLWCDENIGIHDNFFDLGGHSLLSVQLIAETETYLQRSVPLANLGQLSTIAEFVDLLASPAEKAAIEPSPGLDFEIRHQLQSYTSSWRGARTHSNSLITGLNTSGEKQPVFWVVQRYFNLTQLAKHLGPDQPIYAMRSGHRVAGFTEADIPALASCYVDEILGIQSSGPFVVGGICQAAEIAFEIALQLRDRGHELNLLCLQERFIPKDYAGRVAFFFGDISNRSPYFHFARPELGWRKYYTGGFEAYVIRGGHGTYFQEGNIQALTRKMQIAFDQAQATIPVPADDHVPLQRLTRSAYRAKLSVAPPVAVASDEVRLVVKVENTSPETWLASERSGVFLGARWPDSRKQDDTRFRCVHAAQARAALPADLEPGGTTELVLEVRIPKDPCLTTLEVDLVDEGITWFSDAGSDPARIKIPRRRTVSFPRIKKGQLGVFWQYLVGKLK